MRMKFNFLLLITFLTITNFCISTGKELPSNPEIANLMIHEGILDSLEWQRLEPFYTMQLSVPSGELSILKNIYPEIEFNIPVGNEELKKYEPWSEFDVIRFFHDYPELLDFRSILNFNYSSNALRGKSVFTTELDTCTSSINRFQLFLEPTNRIRFSSRVGFTEDYARWYNRTLNVNISKKFSFQIGNIDELPDKGLTYGYFNKSELNIDSSIMTNWIYSNDRSWNGIRLTYNNTAKSNENEKLIIIAHKRSREVIGGMVSEIKIKKTVKLTLGITGVKTIPANEKTSYIFSALNININNIRTEFISGLDVRNPYIIPFLLNTEYRVENEELSCKLIHFPKNAMFSYSKMAHDLRASFRHDKTNHDLSRLVLQSKRKFTKKTFLYSELTIDFSDYAPFNAEAVFRISGSSERYLWSIGVNNNSLIIKNSGRIVSSIEYYIKKNLSIEFDQKYGFKTDTLSFVTFRTAANFLLKSVFSLKPKIEFLSVDRFNEYSAQYGLIFGMQLIHGCQFSLSFDSPLCQNKKKSWRSCKIECKSTFVF